MSSTSMRKCKESNSSGGSGNLALGTLTEDSKEIDDEEKDTKIVIIDNTMGQKI